MTANCLTKNMRVQPFWCVTFWHAKFAIHRREGSSPRHASCSRSKGTPGSGMRLCEWTQFSSYTVSHTPRSRQCCHNMFHTRWQRRRRTGNQAINWTSRMAYNLTNLFYNAPLQTSKMSISDQRKMLRCMVDRVIRCHTLSMHSNRHGKKKRTAKSLFE